MQKTFRIAGFSAVIAGLFFVALLFGSETRGLPTMVIDTIPMAQRLRLPMQAGSRSLNLANAAAIASYEAWRQLGFAGAA